MPNVEPYTKFQRVLPANHHHLLLDVLEPLRVLSLTLQSNETTLADVDEKIQVAKDVVNSLAGR